MKAGNQTYRDVDDIPAVVSVFPLSGALLLPGTQMPLNLFEPRYLAMFDAALAGNRLIGMVQPAFSGDFGPTEKPNLCRVGCLGRITAYSETGDGRYIITLQGICRYRVLEELAVTTPFRQCRIAPFASDLAEADQGDDVDRAALLEAFKSYLTANELEADWDSVEKAANGPLVNALSVMSPYGSAEKQALLEAQTIKARAETLIAITEMSLARGSEDFKQTLQ
ncbi:MAG: LON peptidase substrate-binding domain-containing protein [Pseudomonadota bacterium]